MRILVTGANGYLGTGVVKQLLDKGVDVIATDIKTEGVDSRACRVDANIFSIESPYTYYEKPDALVHLAWRDGFQHNSENHMIDLPNHYLFLKKMIKAGIKQVSVMGSMHEVGFFEGSINESTPTNPLSLYGISKDALRRAVELEAKMSGTVFQWMRGYYIVGNTEKGCSIFSKITAAEHIGQATFPFTSGLNQYDFIDYDELCRQIVAVVVQSEVNGIINCCSGYPVSLGQRVEQFIADNNYKIKLQYGAFPDRAYDSKAVWGDDSRIKTILVGETEANE